GVLGVDQSEGEEARCSARLDIFLQQIALGRAGIRIGGPRRLARRETLTEPGPRALQCTVDGWDAEVEQFGGIFGGPVQHVAQYQGRPLLWCEELDCRQKRDLDRFPYQRHRLWRARWRGGWVEHCVGNRPQPDD